MNWFAFGNTLAEGRQQRKEIDAQREIENFNIRNARQNAQLTAQQTSAREEQQRREARQLLGTQRAAIAQSGVGFSGSSLDIMRQSTTNAELDSLNIRYAGDLERHGILNEIEMREYNARLLKLRGKQVMRMRWGAAIGNLFGGGSGGYGKSGGGALEKSGHGKDASKDAKDRSHGWAKGAKGAYGGYGRVGTGPD